MMKKLTVFLLVLCLAFSGCAQKPEQTETTQPLEPNNTVGICLPDFTWSKQADALKQQLEAAGCEVFLEYASGDLQTQHSQVQALVSMPVGCLVVAAVDSMGLSDVLDGTDVPVIAFDRMLMYTDGVAGGVMADSYAAGQQVGKYIVEAKELATRETPVTIEFFMGSAENHSALLFHQGAMEQLQPYLMEGKLRCLSGRTAFEDSCVQPESFNAASERCFDYLAEYYEDTPLEVLLCGTDTLAAGCIDAVAVFAGELGEEWPLITGTVATQESAENILQGYQSVSVYYDETAQIAQCVQWVQDMIAGEKPEGQNQFNGVIDVPCALQTPVLADKKNIQTLFPEE